MQRSQRLLIFLGLSMMVLIVSASEHLTASLSQKYSAAEDLSVALQEAEEIASSRNGLFERQQQYASLLPDLEDQLSRAMLRKAEARSSYAEVLREIQDLQEHHGVDPLNPASLQSFVDEEEAKFHAFFPLLQRHLQQVPQEDHALALTLTQELLHASLGEMTLLSQQYDALAKARVRVLGVALAASRIAEESPALQEHYNDALAQYHSAWDAYRTTKDNLKNVTQRIEDVQRITEEVQEQVLMLQKELARIDARLVAKLERELIEKGLLNPQPGERSDGRIRVPQEFRWPVIGPVSSGFHSLSYERYFGVEHKGIDIVVPQGTPVSVATDGEVYLARDGGKTGYSYVLVGHRNGIATLYGHLSEITVSSGDEIAAGAIIGYSGGTPGTHGAGPMTTGAHVHFEVIRNGTHIDPRSVLP